MFCNYQNDMNEHAFHVIASFNKHELLSSFYPLLKIVHIREKSFKWTANNFSAFSLYFKIWIHDITSPHKSREKDRRGIILYENQFYRVIKLEEKELKKAKVCLTMYSKSTLSPCFIAYTFHECFYWKTNFNVKFMRISWV